MKNQLFKWLLAAGARPNFMKVAPIIRAICAYNDLNPNSIYPFVLHAGQHYDVNMSDSFLRELNLPKPDINLGMGSCENLLREGILREKIFIVGDIMVDNLLFNLELARKTNSLGRLGPGKESDIYLHKTS